MPSRLGAETSLRPIKVIQSPCRPIFGPLGLDETVYVSTMSEYYVGEMLTCVDIANNTGEPVLHKQSCVTQGPAVCTQVVEHKWCWLSHRVYGRLVLHRVEDIVHRSGNTGCVGDIQRNLCYTGATQGFLTYTGTKPKTAISTQCRLRWHAVALAYDPQRQHTIGDGSFEGGALDRQYPAHGAIGIQLFTEDPELKDLLSAGDGS